MAILGIRIIGDPVLRTPAQEVTDFGPELQKLVEDMDQTMENVTGAGLAAPQVGVSLRVFTYQIGEERGHIVNPVLELSDDYQDDQVEGCLSIPGIAAPVRRRRHVKATGFDKFGNPVEIEGSDMLARNTQIARLAPPTICSWTGWNQKKRKRRGAPCGPTTTRRPPTPR